MDWNRIKEPQLLLNEEICKTNIKRMQLKAERANCKLRPHFKTHQSHQIGQWMKAMGTKAIAVSSLRMAEYFAADGWTDILVAFPVNIREIERIKKLAGKIQLSIILESEESILFLEKQLEHKIGVYIELDLYYGRSGVPIANRQKIDRLLERLDFCPQLNFRGFLSHAGQSYKCRSADEIQALHTSLMQDLRQLKQDYKSKYPHLEISLGDTPSCSQAEGWEEVDEMRPGNYVFYDLMQWQIGACALEEVAVALAAPVVAKHEEKGELILYAGGVHLSKDFIMLGGQACYGMLSFLGKSGRWSQRDTGCYLRSLSQEHGVAKVNKAMMQNIQVGDLVAILPVHSCITADLMGGYLTLDGQALDHMQAHRF